MVGVLTAPYSDSYSFRIKCDDWCKFTLDGYVMETDYWGDWYYDVVTLS